MTGPGGTGAAIPTCLSNPEGKLLSLKVNVGILPAFPDPDYPLLDLDHYPTLLHDCDHRLNRHPSWDFQRRRFWSLPKTPLFWQSGFAPILESPFQQSDPLEPVVLEHPEETAIGAPFIGQIPINDYGFLRVNSEGTQLFNDKLFVLIDLPGNPVGFNCKFRPVA